MHYQICTAQHWKSKICIQIKITASAKIKFNDLKILLMITDGRKDTILL